MSDDADKAGDAIELELRECLTRAASTVHRKPKGCCYNCEAKIPKPKLYCDAECESEHRWYLERLK
jgi:hypothetical protein